MAKVKVQYNSLIDAARVFLSQAIELEESADELTNLYNGLNERVKKKLSPPDVSRFNTLAEKLRSAASITNNIANVYGDLDSKLSTDILLELVCFIMDIDYSRLGDNTKAIMLVMLNTIGMSKAELYNDKELIFDESWLVQDYAWCAMFVTGVLETVFGIGNINPDNAQSIYKFLTYSVSNAGEEEAGYLFDDKSETNFFLSLSRLNFLDSGRFNESTWINKINSYNNRYGTNVSYKDWINPDYKPQVGDLFIYEPNLYTVPTQTSVSHIGVILGTYEKDGQTYVVTVEGNNTGSRMDVDGNANSGNRVMIHEYPIDSDKIMGYVHIDYDSLPADQNQVRKILDKGLTQNGYTVAEDFVRDNFDDKLEKYIETSFESDSVTPSYPEPEAFPESMTIPTVAPAQEPIEVKRVNPPKVINPSKPTTPEERREILERTLGDDEMIAYDNWDKKHEYPYVIKKPKTPVMEEPTDSTPIQTTPKDPVVKPVSTPVEEKPQEETPKPVKEDKPKPHEETPKPVEEEKPKPQEETPKPVKEDKPKPQEETPKPVEEEKPKTQEEIPVPVEEKTTETKPGVEDKPHHSEQKPSSKPYVDIKPKEEDKPENKEIIEEVKEEVKEQEYSEEMKDSLPLEEPAVSELVKFNNNRKYEPTNKQKGQTEKEILSSIGIATGIGLAAGAVALGVNEKEKNKKYKKDNKDYSYEYED